MKKMWFEVLNKDGSSSTAGFGWNHACLFGWAGRNKEEVRKHAKELEEHGIRGPKNMPEHFIVSPSVMTHEGEITCVGDGSCGEIEFFFFLRDGNIYVGVGSEHTDRALEAVDMIKSKAICEKPMSKQVWRYEDVKDHWDLIQLTAWQINEKGEEVVYQDSPLAALITLPALVEEAQKLYDSLEDVIIWSGTIPTVSGLVYGSRFWGEMSDPVLGRKLTFDYKIKTVAADE